MNQLIKQQQTMSSREIAELVEKRHDNVKRTIDTLLEKGLIKPPQIEEVKNNTGQTIKEYLIGKRDSYVIVAQLCPEFTARLVDRWQELEEQQINQIKGQNSHAVGSNQYIEAAKTSKAAALFLKTFIKDTNQLAIAASQIGYKATGIDIIKEAEIPLISARQQQLLTATQLGKSIAPNLSAQKVNRLLEAKGLQTRIKDAKGNRVWAATEKGLDFGLYQDTGKRHSDGTPVRQFKWFDRVIGQV